MKLILFLITIIFTGACYGYAQLAFNPDIGRVPVTTIYKKHRRGL